MSQSSSAPPPPPSQPPAAPPPQQGGGGDAPVDARLDRLEKTQEQQGQLLEKIAAAVTGGGAAAAAAPAGDGAAAAPQGLAQMVRQEIAEADQRRKAEESDEEWRRGVNEVVEQVKAERAPRDPERGFRGRAQRLLFGAPELWAGSSART